jgi:hypothetical protein
MDIHHGSLFPGLEGFARSLGVNLEISLAEQVEAKKKIEAENTKALKILVRAEKERMANRKMRKA